MSRAGYDLGREPGSQKFVSKAAKAVGKAGDIIGIAVMGIGVVLAAADYHPGYGENTRIFLLIGAAGVLFLAGMRCIAGKLDKKRGSDPK